MAKFSAICHREVMPCVKQFCTHAKRVWLYALIETAKARHTLHKYIYAQHKDQRYGCDAKALGKIIL